MKFIIKNSNDNITKNPNVKIIETTEASFTNQVVILENNDVPVIKYTDTESLYFVKNLDNLYQKSKSEVLINITESELEVISSGATSGDSRPYKVYTALLTQSGTDAPVATVLENTLGGEIVWVRSNVGDYTGTLSGAFIENKTAILLNSVDATGTYESYRINNNIIQIRTLDSLTGSDDYLNNSTITIKIY